VKGFWCRAEIKVLYPDQCPLVDNKILSNAQWTAENFWTDWSVELMQVIIAVLWLVCFILLAALIGSFVVFQTKTAPFRGR
jgi:hypothetical protein